MTLTLNSKSVFLATALALSAGTMILIDHYFTPSQIPKNQNCQPHQKQFLKSFLSSGSKKREKEPKKRVQFADDVKDISSRCNANGGKLSRKKHRKPSEIQKSSCGSGILKDRLQRMECSF